MIKPGTLYQINNNSDQKFNLLWVINTATGKLEEKRAKNLEIWMYLETTTTTNSKNTTPYFCGTKRHWFLDSKGKKIYCTVHGTEEKQFFEEILRKVF
jgi:uncharacterized protein YijF (DUF1287 family)